MDDTTTTRGHQVRWEVKIKGLITKRTYTYTIKAAPNAYAGDVLEQAIKHHHTALRDGRVSEPPGTGHTAAPKGA